MDFSPLTPGDFDKLAPYLSCSRMIDMGFCSLYSVLESCRPEFCFCDGCLVLRMDYGGTPAYAHPLGPLDGARLSRIVKEAGGESLVFDYVPSDALPLYSMIEGYRLEAKSFEKYTDYFSLASDFTDKKRTGHPRKYTDYLSFINHFTCEVKDISRENIPDCLYLFDKWCEGRDCAKCVYGCEKKMEGAVFNEWEHLPAKGIIVYIGGEPQGYLFGEQNGDTALILYGKPVGRQNGLNVFMHITLIDRCFPGAKYVNFSPDSGVDGLRLFKSKFRPFTRIAKYYCELKRE